MTIATDVGGNVYSGDVQYDNYSAAHVRECVVRLWDWSLLRYRLVRAVVADLGRYDDPTPADADAAMQDEPLPTNRQPHARKTQTQEATYRAQLYTDRQRAERINLIMELLREGPCSTAKAAAHIGVTPRIVKYLLPFAPDIREYGRRADGVWIGLVNQSIPARKRRPITGNALACYIHIRTHGPSTLTELAQALNQGKTVLRSSMRNRNDVFVASEHVQTGKYHSKTTRWGLLEGGN